MLAKFAAAAITAATVAALAPPAHAIDPVCGVLRHGERPTTRRCWSLQALAHGETPHSSPAQASATQPCCYARSAPTP